MPLFTRPLPSVAQRGTVAAPITTGFKTLDSFQPIIRGSTLAVAGERGTGKAEFARDIIIEQAKQNKYIWQHPTVLGPTKPASWVPPVFSVIAMVGASPQRIYDMIANLKAEGAMGHTVIVAAPGPLLLHEISSFSVSCGVGNSRTSCSVIESCP